jgi:serine/threonine protein kinase
MPRLRLLLRCIGEAICVEGIKILASAVPFGDALYEIGSEAWVRLRRHANEQEVLGAVEEAARASVPQAREEAEAAVQSLGVELAPQERGDLVAYLTQVPAAVRQSLKRPSDPTGTTVPASFTLTCAEQLVPLLPTHLPRFHPGDRPQGIGNWELVELLGTGGFGEVWKAEHPSLKGIPPVALKFCLDASAAHVLRHEARLLNRVMQQCRHPGFVSLRQAYLDSDPLCLEYEYVSGGDLAGLLADWQHAGKLCPDAVHHLLLRIAEIVGYAHRLNPPIVHRDLKPANILIQRVDGGSFKVRVADFGIGGIAAARAVSASKSLADTSGRLTTSLRGSHTPLYASPQQMRGAPPDPRDDVHALGVLWYQMLTGDLGNPVPTDWVRCLREIRLEQSLIDLLEGCIASRLEHRLTDAAVLAQRLSQLLASAEEVLDVLPVEAPPAPRKPAAPATTQTGARPRRPSNSTQRAAPEEVLDVLPVEDKPRAPVTRRPAPAPTHRAPAPRPASRPAPAASGNRVQFFPAAQVDMGDLVGRSQSWLQREGFTTQVLQTEDSGTLIQVEKQGSWRKFLGMSTALNVVLRREGDELAVEVGAGQWIDKAAAGVVSIFILWPLAVTAAIGAWDQMKLPERIFDYIANCLHRRDTAATNPPRAADTLGSDAITRIKELAALRDQGILTEEEFQAQKARLLQ